MFVSWKPHTNSPSPKQVFDYHLIKRLIITVGHKMPGADIIKTADLFDQSQKSPPAVLEVLRPMRHIRGPEWVDIETDVLTTAAVTVAFERAHLVESGAQIVASKGLVLVEL